MNPSLKEKSFFWGFKIGAAVCNTVPYFFMAGVLHGFNIFIDNVRAKTAQAERQAEWKARAEGATWKPGT